MKRVWEIGTFVACVFIMACAAKKTVTSNDNFKDEGPASSSSILKEDLRVGQGTALKVAYSMVHFDFDSARIRKDAMMAISNEAQKLRKDVNMQLLIKGACDERGTVAYNLGLGIRRARAIRDELVKRGISKSRIQIQSLGKLHPIAIGHDEEAWALNRRGEFHFSTSGKMAKKSGRPTFAKR